MQQETEIQEYQAPQLNEIQNDRASSLALITNDENMARVTAMAKMMASSKVTVPKHLQGNDGDCMAVIIQATNWGMNPFAVAQKTHLVNGVLGYEAQLVNAVIQSSNSISGNFHYEYRGEGAALECRVGAVIRGDSEITWGEWLREGSVTTKNSPLWKTNPKQQMGYLQVKNWSRLYCPGAILGVYTPDELEINPAPAQRQPSRSGAEAAAAAKTVTVENGQEEKRAALIAQFEQHAQQGSDMFIEKWKQLPREDRLLIGAEEYERMGAASRQVDEQFGSGSEG
jgi:hypothetical protein